MNPQQIKSGLLQHKEYFFSTDSFQKPQSSVGSGPYMSYENGEFKLHDGGFVVQKGTFEKIFPIGKKQSRVESKMKKHQPKLRYLLENELQYSRQERTAFLESLKQFPSFKEAIYRGNSLQEVCAQIGRMIESANGFTLRETDKWFDNITVNRDMKRISEAYKTFEKTCNEITQLQQRLESCYEDIGSGLTKYYEL